MKPKSLAILSALALVLIFVAIFALRTPTASSSDASALLFPTLREQAGKVAKIHVQRANVETLLTLDERASKPVWTVENRSGYPVDVDHVRQLVAALAEATIVEPKTSKPDLYAR